jgi:hypothetical protein
MLWLGRRWWWWFPEDRSAQSRNSSGKTAGLPAGTRWQRRRGHSFRGRGRARLTRYRASGVPRQEYELRFFGGREMEKPMKGGPNQMQWGSHLVKMTIFFDNVFQIPPSNQRGKFSPAARKPRLSSWMRTASHWRTCAPSTLWKRVDDRAVCPCSKSRSNGAPTSVPRRRMHATFALPPSIRYVGRSGRGCLKFNSASKGISSASRPQAGR